MIFLSFPPNIISKTASIDRFIMVKLQFRNILNNIKCGSSGGQGVQTPPGKSQVIWVSIGNKQLDPPWKKLDPPPPENDAPPLEL